MRASKAIGSSLMPSNRCVNVETKGCRKKIFSPSMTDYVPSHLHLTNVRLAGRTQFHPNIPIRFRLIINNEAGDHHYLDLSGSSEDPRVVSWAHDDGDSQTPESGCESFFRWLFELVAEAA